MEQSLGNVQATADVATPAAPRYLAQLAKHFAHKVDVAIDGDQARFSFVCGTARLKAEPDRLSIEVGAADEQGLVETEEVVERHLVRFAFRENLGPITWSRV